MSDSENLKSLQETVNKSDVKALEKQVSKSKGQPKPDKHPDDRRFEITVKFVERFFLITACVIFLCLLYNAIVAWTDTDKITPIDVGNILSLIFGQLGASLAVIIGFYFKDKQ